jgi:hypothetical protein
MDLSVWNSLEIAKLVVAVFTPLAVVVVGIRIHRVTKRFEHAQWRSQKLVEKRLAIYDELAPHLNDLLCYFTYVGCWRDLDPPYVVKLKRIVDKHAYIAMPLFSPEFFAACMALQDLCFKQYNGWGLDATLRTSPERRRKARSGDWDVSWDACFSEDLADRSAIRRAYERVMLAFSNDIGVDPPKVALPSRTGGKTVRDANLKSRVGDLPLATKALSSRIEAIKTSS